jgi:putative inorganic carbon (HCO3(-)) transporter
VPQKISYSNILLYGIWLLACVFITFVASIEFKYGILAIAGILGLSIGFICMMYYKIGFYIYIGITMILPMLEKMIGTQISNGLIMDAILVFCLLGCLFKRGHPTFFNINFKRDPLLICLYIYILVLIFQLINPSGFNPGAWLIFMRVFIRGVLFTLLALNVFNTKKDFYFFFKFWFFLCTAAAAYACVQQWIGLFPYERAFVAKYPELFKTTIILSGIRIFSFMSDAAAFGIIMACNVTMLLILLTVNKRELSNAKKLLICISIILHLLALGYSGTRTGYVMVPLGIFLFILTTINNRNTIIASIFICLAGAAVLYGPFHGATVTRVRSAFIGKQDASLDVRDINRKKAQPYLHTHPLGGGLLTTGGNALIFHRGHPMANLQTDNGYLRAGLETGWIGLLMVAGNFILVIQMGIVLFFRLHKQLDKLLILGVSAAILELALAQYTQDASTLIETSIMFNAFTAILLKLKYVDTLNLES